MDEWDRYRIGDHGALSDDAFALLLRRVIEARNRGDALPMPDARVTREAARCYAENRGFGRRRGQRLRWRLTDEGAALLRAHGLKIDEAPDP